MNHKIDLNKENVVIIDHNKDGSMDICTDSGKVYQGCIVASRSVPESSDTIIVQERIWG